MNSLWSRDPKQLSRALYFFLLFALFVAMLLPGLALLHGKEIITLDWLNDRNMGFYRRHGILRALVFFAFLGFHKPIKAWLEKICTWAVDVRGTGRRATLVLAVVMFVCSALHAHILIVTRGVPGWTYAGYQSLLVDELPQTPVVSSRDKDVLQAAILTEPLKYIKGNGYVSGDILLLEFTDGQRLPGSLALTRNSWPERTFAIEGGAVLHNESFFRMVQKTLDIYRQGKSYILPQAISYPSHISANRIDYTSYPPASELEAISIWDVTVKFDDETDTATVVNAQQKALATRPAQQANATQTKATQTPEGK